MCKNDLGNKTNSKTSLVQSTLSTSSLSRQGLVDYCFQREMFYLLLNPVLLVIKSF